MAAGLSHLVSCKQEMPLDALESHLKDSISGNFRFNHYAFQLSPLHTRQPRPSAPLLQELEHEMTVLGPEPTAPPPEAEPVREPVPRSQVAGKSRRNFMSVLILVPLFGVVTIVPRRLR